MIGMFAGRGDVVLAMALAMLVGGFIGWKLKSLQLWFKSMKSK